jgi:hypothetical protein
LRAEGSGQQRFRVAGRQFARGSPAEDLEIAAPSLVPSETGDSRSKFGVKSTALGHQPRRCNHLIRLGIAKTQVIFRIHIDPMRSIPRE